MPQPIYIVNRFGKEAHLGFSNDHINIQGIHVLVLVRLDEAFFPTFCHYVSVLFSEFNSSICIIELCYTYQVVLETNSESDIRNYEIVIG